MVMPDCGAHCAQEVCSLTLRKRTIKIIVSDGDVTQSLDCSPVEAAMIRAGARLFINKDGRLEAVPFGKARPCP